MVYSSHSLTWPAVMTWSPPYSDENTCYTSCISTSVGQWCIAEYTSAGMGYNHALLSTLKSNFSTKNELPYYTGFKPKYSRYMLMTNSAIMTAQLALPIAQGQSFQQTAVWHIQRRACTNVHLVNVVHDFAMYIYISDMYVCPSVHYKAGRSWLGVIQYWWRSSEASIPNATMAVLSHCSPTVISSACLQGKLHVHVYHTG